MAKKQSSSSDPVHSIVDGLLKGIWWLVSYPFRDRNQQAKLERIRAEFRAHWQQIEAMAGAGQLREAIMQADILLDKALVTAGISGTTLGERLKLATSRLSKPLLDAAWSAHKVRNRLAHELQYQLSTAEAKQALADFKKVLRELGVL